MQYNVLNIEPARKAIRELFLGRIVHAKGLSKVRGVVEGILMPTPSAVLSAVRLLSAGCKEENGLGELMVVDVGGATTDVYSISEGKPPRTGVNIKGLPGPFAMRTVEGDLGVRYSAGALAEAAGIDRIISKSGLSGEEVVKYMELFVEHPEKLAVCDEKIDLLDFGLACMAVKLSVERHTGRLETVYTPFGAGFIQTGKDLTGIKKVIGTGGPVINSNNPAGILREALSDGNTPVLLRPVDAEFMLDRKYIMAAMGLLGERYPGTALRIMKKELEVLTN